MQHYGRRFRSVKHLSTRLFAYEARKGEHSRREPALRIFWDVEGNILLARRGHGPLHLKLHSLQSTQYMVLHTAAVRV